MYYFRPEAYVKLYRIDKCIPEMSSLKEEEAKWKINMKHEPGCALHIKSETIITTEKVTKNEPDDLDDKTNENCKSKEKATGEQCHG